MDIYRLMTDFLKLKVKTFDPPGPIAGCCYYNLNLNSQ